MNKLREAAQAVIAAKSTSDMVLAMERLRDALAEDRLNEMQAITASDYLPPKRDAEPVALYVRAEAYEYDYWGDVELWGRVTGGPGGRWAVEQIDGRVWPDGMALYVRVEK